MDFDYVEKYALAALFTLALHEAQVYLGATVILQELHEL